MTTGVSEERLSAALAAILARAGNDAGVPRLPVLLREFEARQGRADFVGVECHPPALRKAAMAGWGKILARPAAATVYSFTRAAPRTEVFLAERTGLSRATLRSCLADLRAIGLLRETPTGSVVRARLLPKPDVWAFEVKVANWRRALFQALQYQAFAHRVVVVLSAEFAHRAIEHESLFQALGVGLLIIDTTENAATLERSVAPRRARPSSGAYHLHALGQIIDRAGV